ncbi:unnamed protein product [Ixodes hexagonus]
MATVSLWLLVSVLLDAADWTVLNGVRAQELQQQTKGGLADNSFEGPSANAGAQDLQQQTNGGLKDDSFKGPSAKQSHPKEGLKRRRHGGSPVGGAGPLKGARPSRETSLGHGGKSVKGAYSGVAVAQRRQRHRAGLKRKYVQRQYARKNMAEAPVQHRLQAVRETGLKGRTVFQRGLGSELASVPEPQKRAVPVQQTNMLKNSVPNQDFNKKLLVPDVVQEVEPLQQTDLKRAILSKPESPMRQSVSALQKGLERKSVPYQDSNRKSSRAQKPYQAARPVQQTGSVLETRQVAAPALHRGLKGKYAHNQYSKGKALPVLEIPQAATPVQQAGLKGRDFRKSLSSKAMSVVRAQQQNALPPLQRGLNSNPVPSQNSKAKSLAVPDALQGAEPAQQTSLKGTVFKAPGRKAAPAPERQQNVRPLQRGLKGNSVPSRNLRKKTQPVSNYLQAAKPAQQTGLKGPVLKTLGRKTAAVPERQQGAVPSLQTGLKGNSVPSQDLSRKTQLVSSYLQAAKSAPQTGLKGAVPNQGFGRQPVAPQEVHRRAAQALQKGLENNPLSSGGQYIDSPLIPKTLGGVKQQTSVNGKAPAKDLNSKYAFAPEQQRATSDLQAAWKQKSYQNQVSAKNFDSSNAQQKVQPVQQTGLKGRSAPNQNLSRKSPSLPQAQESVNPDQTTGLKGRAASDEEAKTVEVQEPQQRAGPIQETELKRNPALKQVLSQTASAVEVHKEARQAQQSGPFPRQNSNHQEKPGLNSVPVKAVQALQGGNSIQQDTFFWQGKTAEQAGQQQSPVGRHAKAPTQEQAASSHLNRNVDKLQSSQYKTLHLVPSSGNGNPGQGIPAQQTQEHNKRLAPLQNGGTILQSPEQVRQQVYSRDAASALHQGHGHPLQQQQLYQHQVHSRHTASALQRGHEYPQHQQLLHEQQVQTLQDLPALQQQRNY